MVFVFHHPLLHVYSCVEITAFSDRHAEFEALNTEILAVSVDSVVGAFFICIYITFV